MRYRLFDFTIDSDIEFPELEADRTGAPALTLCQASTATVPADARWLQHIPTEDQQGLPWLSIARTRGGYLLEFHGQVRIRYETPLVAWTRSGAIGDDSLRHLLLDQAFPLIAAQEGRTVLHAASASDGGRTYVFAGPAGAGKSTLVASLLGRGWCAASDDAAAVSVEGSHVRVQPSYGGVRLWPDSSSALGYSGGAAVSDRSDKQRFAVSAVRPARAALGGIYVLRAARGRARPRVRDLTARDAVMALIANAYVLDIQDHGQARARLDTLSDAVSRVRVRELTIPHRFEALPQVHALVGVRPDSRVVA